MKCTTRQRLRPAPCFFGTTMFSAIPQTSYYVCSSEIKPHVGQHHASQAANVKKQSIEQNDRNPARRLVLSSWFSVTPLCFGEEDKKAKKGCSQTVAASRSLRSCCLRKPARSRISTLLIWRQLVMSVTRNNNIDIYIATHKLIQNNINLPSARQSWMGCCQTF